MSEQNQQRAKETILDEFKLALKAPRLDNGDKDPTLRVGIYENNPRIRVKTNVPGDKNNGYIDAAMTSHAFFAICEAIRMIARSEEGMVDMVLGLDGHPFMNGQRSKDKLPVGAVNIVKQNDGRMTITISGGKNRPLITFDFMLDDYHHFKDGQGNPMNKALAYRISAVAWANMMEKYVTQALRHFVMPAWRMRDNNGQGGGGQRQGGYQGGGQRQGGYQGGNQNGGYQNRQQGGGGNQGNGGGYGDNNRPSQPSNNSWDDDVPL